jgi:hypothetical protein
VQSRSQKRRAVLEKECDVLWSRFIRERFNYRCAWCDRAISRNAKPSEDGGAAHHIIGKRNKDHRHEEYNGILLCGPWISDCHARAHSNQAGLVEWLKDKQPEIYAWHEEHRADRPRQISVIELEDTRAFLKAMIIWAIETNREEAAEAEKKRQQQGAHPLAEWHRRTGTGHRMETKQKAGV